MTKKPVKGAKKGSVKSSKKGSKKGSNAIAKKLDTWLVDRAATIRNQLAAEDKKNPPREFFAILEDHDKVCDKLHEVVQLMDSAMYDLEDLNSNRASALICIAERFVKEAYEKSSDLSLELYKIHRMHFLK